MVLLAQFIDFQAAIIVNLEGLNVGVHFHAPQPQLQNMLHIALDIGAVGMEGTQPRKAALPFLHSAGDELIDTLHLLGN